MTTLTMRTPSDVIATVPSLLGFHPTESTVMVTVGAQHAFHARIDLPTVEDDFDEVAKALAAPLATHRVPQALFVFYTDDYARARSQFVALRDRIVDETPTQIVDAFQVHDGKYRSVMWDDGKVHAVESSHLPTEAAVANGCAPLSNRDALRKMIEPGADLVPVTAIETYAIKDPNPTELVSEAKMLHDFVFEFITSGREIEGIEECILLHDLTHPMLRDAAWITMSRENARQSLTFWSALARRAPESHRVEPLAMTAFAAYLLGDGALAWIVVDALRVLAPDHRLANMLDRALTEALPPATWTPPSLDEVIAEH